MPRYDHRCRDCGAVFEVTRPMAESALPATCPEGHRDSVRLLSTIALTGAGVGGGAPAPAQAPPAGGCCGGGCCG